MLVATLLFTALSWMIPVVRTPIHPRHQHTIPTSPPINQTPSPTPLSFSPLARPQSKRIFHILTTLITLIATLSYFSMATSHAVLYHHTVVHTPVSHAPIRLTHDIYRQVFWAHYVDWALSTPLVLLDLALLAGLSGAHTLLAVVADVVMVLCGLFAALGQHGTGQRWGWFAFACVAFLAVVWQLVVNGRRVAVARGGDAGRFYQALAAYTVVVWLAYPIIWGVVSGSRRLSVDGEVIAYGVLDVLAKVVFGAVLLGAHMVTPELGVEVGGFWANGLNKEGMVRLPEEQENGG
ncbi:hypothetical protein BDY21DRAFT_107772 [Lineolata rhizophorae]|uniref:Opsin-1 n=1 Tax=Lineolata rhizophorae TaxID=578093 RepID=A0A6A6NS17_9PEZI|nr:hypothetical protein BDY21DRAFT_107772 [Lineolata rhizophorae]